ncbi:MAG: HAD-IIIA family hydrolase [Candidatus Omnitrophica bacterium]|nr:HAD-IIIA family hydrolase [Candidatus Omnitrophota bacterium]
MNKKKNSSATDYLRQAAILCGGRGERLRPLTDTIPKPMLPVNGKPFLEYLLEQLKDNGIKEVVLLTGYLGGQIREYFGNGERVGLTIKYSHGPIEWETGRRLAQAKSMLDERFLLLYSDNFVPFDLKKSLRFNKEQDKLLTFIVHPKDKGNIRLGGDGQVIAYDKSRSSKGLDFVELGYMVVSKKVFDYYTCENPSFSDIISILVLKGQVSGEPVLSDYYSISDLERLKLAEKYLLPKKILLIDRDGVINQKAPRGEYIDSWDKFVFIRENIDGMKKLFNLGFNFIIISNQAGIGRGVVSAEAVRQIHEKMRAALRDRDVKILDIYVCPHHWEDKCSCRKPEPGLFFQASREHLFRLDKTFFIGDDPRDCQAAYRAGCKSIYIGKNKDLAEIQQYERPELVVNNLKEAVTYLEAA